MNVNILLERDHLQRPAWVIKNRGVKINGVSTSTAFESTMYCNFQNEVVERVKHLRPNQKTNIINNARYIRLYSQCQSAS